jgi:RNA ligase
VFNQGVVKYPFSDLVLLGAFYTKSGTEIAPKQLFNTLSGVFQTAKIFNISSSFEEIKALNWENEEGFVVRFASGFRCKIKFLDYIEKHKNKFQLSNKLIWEALKNNTWNDLINIIPDEFDNWAKEIKAQLEAQFEQIHREVVQKFEQVKMLPTRKDIALAIKDYRYKNFVFAEIDKKEYFDDIWDKIKPEYEKATPI